VIVDGGGYGQLVKAFPSMGYETVLDAIEKIGGLPAVSSKRKIWVARPSPANHHCTQVLPVDWNAITQGGSTPTNYQIFPGDRIYVRADPFIAANNWLGKMLAPVERILGVALLATSVGNSINNNGNNTGFVIAP
jgi:polysaccharide export outer membrane protein